MGKFSVNNLFEGIKKAVEEVIKFQLAPFQLIFIKLPQEVAKAVMSLIQEPIVKPIVQILSLAVQTYAVFKEEIRYVAKGVEGVPADISKRVERYVQASMKEAGTKAKLFLKPQLTAIDTTVAQIKQLRKLEADLRNPNKLAKMTEEAANRVLTALVRKSAFGGFVDFAYKSTTKKTQAIPFIAMMRTSGTQVTAIVKYVAKNDNAVISLIKKTPQILAFLEPFLKATGKGGKSLLKAVPIIGELWQAIDQELINGEIKELGKEFKRTNERIKEIRDTQIKRELAWIQTNKKLDAILAAIKAPTVPGSKAATIDYTRIAQIVKANSAPTAAQAKATDPNAIANAVVAKLPKQNISQIDYNRISGLINNAVRPLTPKPQPPVNLAPIMATLNRIEGKIPTTQAITQQITQNIKPITEPAKPVDLTPITATLNGFKTTLNTIASTTQAGNVGINAANAKLDNLASANATHATKGDITTAINSLTTTDNNNANSVWQKVQAEHQATRAMIKPLAQDRTVSVNDANMIAIATSDVIRANNEQRIIQAVQAAKPVVLPGANNAAELAEMKKELEKQSELAKDTYKLLGGDKLKQGVTSNQEPNLLAAGMRAFQGSGELIKDIPTLMAGMMAISHFRGGLHRVPADLPGSLTDPAKPVVRVTDKLAHDQHLWRLADEKVGAPTPIKMTGPNGLATTSTSRNLNESLDTIQAQTAVIDQEMEILQQAVIKLASETLKINMIVLQDHSILESIRDFLGFRYTEEKRNVPTEISLGKNGLADWLASSSLHYVATKMDQKFDLTQMQQKIFLEVGKSTASTFARFDPANPNQEIIGDKFTKPNKTKDDDELKKFVKLAEDNPASLGEPTHPKVKIEKYTNNDTVKIDTSGVTLPTG